MMPSNYSWVSGRLSINNRKQISILTDKIGLNRLMVSINSLLDVQNILFYTWRGPENIAQRELALMINYYLLFISPETARSLISHTVPRFTLPHSASYLQQDDRIILVRMGDEATVLPFIYKIAAT